MNLKKMMKKNKPEQPCQHYWLIEPPGADTSLGICKYCGKHKRFANSYQYRANDKMFKKRVPANAEAVSLQ
jgi:hypothetical protein